MKLNFKKNFRLNKKIQWTRNKRDANLAEPVARAADLGRWAASSNTRMDTWRRIYA
jgi:hypothetical protein